jgi:AhpD family alkylhydroperoxidase
MRERMRINKVVPDGYKAVLGLEQYVRGKVEHRLFELIKLRASYVNGCAFCIDMHSRDALQAGESAQRLFAVAAWREAPFFSKQERAAFALTDAVTLIADGGVPDEVWNEAGALWSEEEVADLILAISTINAWNRIAISTHAQPPAAG